MKKRKKKKWVIQVYYSIYYGPSNVQRQPSVSLHWFVKYRCLPDLKNIQSLILPDILSSFHDRLLVNICYLKKNAHVHEKKVSPEKWSQFLNQEFIN